jgi:ABC-type uncharacterized transport system ATPase subunit
LGVIADGKLITIDTIDSLKEKYSFDKLIIKSKDYDKEKRIIKTIKGFEPSLFEGSLIIKSRKIKITDAVKIAKALKYNVDDFKIEHGRVQDVFLTILSEVKSNGK